MISEPPLPSGMGETYDLAGPSEFNYRRHRTWRYSITGVGVAAAVSLVLYTWTTTANATPELLDWGRLAFVAASVLVGYFCIVLAWIPFRLLARPPVSLTLSNEQIELGMQDGTVFHLRWTEERLRGELLFRGSDLSTPPDSRYRLLIGRGAYDYRAPWRALPPATYLSEACAKRILEVAREVQVSIEKVDSPTPASLGRSKSSWTAYLITGRTQ
jgi:hypothetical protein